MKMRESKRSFILCYMAGFFIGILYANIISGDYILNAGILDDFFLENYIKTDVDMSGYLCYVAYIRLLSSLPYQEQSFEREQPLDVSCGQAFPVD